MGTFSLDISKFVAKAKANINQVTRKIVIDIAANIVSLSPVGDAAAWKHPPPKGYVGGRFRANWLLGEGTAPTGALPDIDPTGAASTSRVLATLPPDAAGKVFYLMNNLPYAQRLEEGWSGQAPNGMVMQTVIRWNVIVDNAVNGVRAGTGDSGMADGFEAYGS